jgi:hypothetical protein
VEVNGTERKLPNGKHKFAALFDDHISGTVFILQGTTTLPSVLNVPQAKLVPTSSIE